MQTRYDGPLHSSDLEFGGRPVRLVRPSEPDRLLEAADVLDLNHRDDYMPYWAYIWPGAYLLAEAVAREPWPHDQRVLEIGCGLGLAGLVALQAGARVHFTDYDETPLDFVARSAGANGIDPASYTTARLDWRELPDERFPVILGADVLYERRLVPLVANLIATLLEPGGFALVAGPYRVATEDLPGALERAGLTAGVSAIEARDEAGRPVAGTLHRIRHLTSP